MSKRTPEHERCIPVGISLTPVDLAYVASTAGETNSERIRRIIQESRMWRAYKEDNRA